MKFTKYIKDKINYILGFIVNSIIILAYANAMAVDKNFIIIITIMSFIFCGVGLLVSYWRKNKYRKDNGWFRRKISYIRNNWKT